MNPTPNTRLASQPFTITLAGNDYTLERGELEAQLDEKLLRKTAVFNPHLQFKSLRGKQLTLINNFREESYLMRIGIEPGSITVSCSCGQPVQTICLHSYRALSEIAWRRDGYFERFAPAGWAVTALANKKAFAFNDDQLGPIIKPLPPHASVYGLNCNLSANTYLLYQPQPPANSSVQVAYLILTFSRRRTPPILMPCLYIPVKTGNKIKTLHSFAETIAANNQQYFTETQLLLNKLCLSMLKEAEQLKPADCWHGTTWNWEQYEPIFKLWQQCWPLLCMQPAVYCSHIYHLRFLRKKPWLKETLPVAVSTETVRPLFLLKAYPGHRRLSMSISHHQQQLSSESGILPFFVNCPETNCLYLLPTIKMAQLVAQLHDAGPFISIFNQQYKSFQKEVLAPLQKQKLLVITKQKNKAQIKAQGTGNKAQALRNKPAHSNP